MKNNKIKKHLEIDVFLFIIEKNYSIILVEKVEIMNKNKQILRHCPNFYKIINFEYYDDDELSKKLIDVYEKYVFKVDLSDKNEVKRLEQLDLVLNKYIDDYFFRKELKTEMKKIRVRKNEDILSAIVKWIIHVFDNYEVGYTRNIYFSRWL